jgi:predicted O-methyltransferase YrrM
MTQQSSAQDNPWLEGSTVEFAPIVDVLFPAIDLSTIRNPIAAIIDHPRFKDTERFFATAPSVNRSLLTPLSQALLYTLIRNIRPHNVVEIGTYKGGTSETMTRALLSNGFGTLHTVSPFDVERFGAHFDFWPEPLRQHICYYPVDSMMYFAQLDRKGIRPELVLIDGNHDYEFVNFDLQASAQRLARDGFILLDNVSQAGPYFAASEFLDNNPLWADCGLTARPRTTTKAFEPRTTIPYTDFFIIRAPKLYVVGRRPLTFGVQAWSAVPVKGLKLSLGEGCSAGTLHVQAIFRAFSEKRVVETNCEAAQEIDGGTPEIEIAFAEPLGADGAFHAYGVEPWLVWDGAAPLMLRSAPTLF